MSEAGDGKLAGRGRRIAGVIAATMLLWLVAQWVGAAAGLPGRWAFVADFAALAAFLWAVVAALNLRRARRDEPR